MSLTLVNVRDYLLRTIGQEDPDAATVTTAMLNDVLAAVNYALQTLRTAGPDFFTRSPVAVTLVAGTAAYDLDDGVQSVLGPVRLGGRTLRALTSRNELDNFGLIYLGQTTPGVENGRPLAYFIEALTQALDDDHEDPSLLRLHLVPAPNSANAGSLTLDGVLQVTRLSDFDDDLLPVPQQYVETLFLPIARKHVSGSIYFSSSQLKEQIEAEFAEAMAKLPRSGGFPPAAGRKEKREVEA